MTFRFSSITYCITATNAPAAIQLVSVESTAPPSSIGSVDDVTSRTAAGCYTLTYANGTLAASTNLLMVVSIAGTSGMVQFTSVTSTWTPALA